ncbi:MAG: glycosyltransferase [Lachnospiraceae bacterium]|nr:glycosyltransferase [Lachnospiraceae bacterium]
MKILFFKNNSTCEPDVIIALEDLGHTVDVAEIEKEKNGIVERVNQTEYDALFSIGFSAILAEAAEYCRIRYISWTINSMNIELFSDVVKSKWNRIFIFDKAECERFEEYNPGKVFHMPLAANVKRLDELFLSLGGQKKFNDDISFVGSLYNEKNPISKMKNLSESYVGGFLRASCDIQSRLYGGFVLEDILSEDIIDEIKNNIEDFYTPPETIAIEDSYLIASLYLAPWATTIERERIAEMLYKNFRFGLYTRSPLSHLALSGKGAVNTMTEMPQVFRNSVINLNLTHKGIRSGIPLRVFDIMGAGGFMLTGYQPELFDLFVPGEDFDYFTSDEELLIKCRYYMNRKNEAKEIAMNAYEKVKAEHTYQHRLDEVIKLAFESV